VRLDAVGQRADEVQVGELVREAAVLARHRPQRAPPLAAADERVEGVLDLAHQIRHRARERERLCREAGGRRRPQRRRRLVARRRARIVARRACRRRRRRLGLRGRGRRLRLSRRARRRRDRHGRGHRRRGARALRRRGGEGREALATPPAAAAAHRPPD